MFVYPKYLCWFETQKVGWNSHKIRSFFWDFQFLFILILILRKERNEKIPCGCAIYSLNKTGGKIALKSASSVSEMSAMDQLCFGDIIPIKRYTQKETTAYHFKISVNFKFLQSFFNIWHLTTYLHSKNLSKYIHWQNLRARISDLIFKTDHVLGDFTFLLHYCSHTCIRIWKHSLGQQVKLSGI